MTATNVSDELASLRAQGWCVAVHNDYRIGGKPHTFWLFTHECGRWIKGEGSTDAEALKQAASSVATLSPPLPSTGVERLNWRPSGDPFKDALHYGSRCRDCADENGICPTSGLPCGGREKAIAFVIDALRHFGWLPALSALPLDGGDANHD